MLRQAQRVLVACVLLAGCAPDLQQRCADDPTLSACFVDDAPDPLPGGGKADGVTTPDHVWPGGDVYLIVEDSAGSWIREALDTASRQLAAHTPIQVHLIPSAEASPNGYYAILDGRFAHMGGQAQVGAWAGGQIETSYDSLTHEMGHLLGLFHMQQRIDRDENIVVHWPYISAKWATQFELLSATTAHIGPYDLGSVMQYETQPLGHIWCSALSRPAPGNTADNCVSPFAAVLDGLRDEPLAVRRNTEYSDWDFARISRLYCDPVLCETSCASAERCGAPLVQQHLALIRAWEQSPAGQAWRQRYPGAARYQ